MEIFFILIILVMTGFAVLAGAAIQMAKADKQDREAQRLLFHSRSPYYRRKRDR